MNYIYHQKNIQDYIREKGGKCISFYYSFEKGFKSSKTFSKKPFSVKWRENESDNVSFTYKETKDMSAERAFQRAFNSFGLLGMVRESENEVEFFDIDSDVQASPKDLYLLRHKTKLFIEEYNKNSLDAMPEAYIGVLVADTIISLIDREFKKAISKTQYANNKEEAIFMLSSIILIFTEKGRVIDLSSDERHLYNQCSPDYRL